MRAICVDDETLVMQLMVSMCRELPGMDAAEGFTSAEAALRWLEANSADIAILDIDMPGINGIQLARRIREMRPETAIIFSTGYAQYALEAFELHASGYLLKPVSREKLATEVAYALSDRREARQGARVAAQTFGNFELFVNGDKVDFERSKSKELLAYLVEKQGSGVTRAEAASILWEDAPYDRPMQKQLDVIVRSLRTTLEKRGVGDLLEVHGGQLRILSERIDCDMYRFLKGDVDAINSYRGEFMSAYSWASMTEAEMTRSKHPD